MATFYLPENQRELIASLFGAERPFSTMYDVAIFAAMVCGRSRSLRRIKNGMSEDKKLQIEFFVQKRPARADLYACSRS